MRKLLLLPLLAAVLAVGSLSTASAHSRPILFDPDPGAVLDAAPSEVTGWFSSDIRRVEESFIHVLNEAGEEVQTGELQLTTDRRQMSTALSSGLAEGRYVVHWSTFDDVDGEVFSGCHTFFVGQAAADQAVDDGVPLDGGEFCPATSGEEQGHTHEDGEAGTADPANAPAIKLSIPETVSSDSVTLDITPTNFTPRAPDGSTVDSNSGHYHIYLDKVPLDVITGEHEHAAGGHEEGEMDMSENDASTGAQEDMAEMDGEGDASMNPGGLVENPVMWLENSYTFTDLEPGFHTVTVVLNHDDHTPLNPPVVESTSFQVETDDDGGIPAWALALGVVGGLIVGTAGMKLISIRM